MKPGDLWHLIDVDEPVTTQDDTGAQVDSWAPLLTVSGSIEPLRGREVLQANAITGDMDTRIRIRWTPQLDAMSTKWRLRYRAVIYNIVSIAHIELRQREIEIMCKSGLNSG